MKGLFTTLFAGLAAVAPVLAASEFSLNKEETLFTFDYSTDSSDDTNWIGLFSSSSAPKDGEKVGDSTTWKYAKESSGSVTIPADSMSPGSYEAFFLAQDGYESLADSIEVTVPARFLPNKGITLHNGRQGSDYEAYVGGLMGNVSGSDIEFSISSGADWAEISKDGIITGKPTESGSTTLTLKGAMGDASDELELTIPVVGKDDKLVSELKVMTWNLWHEGTQVNNYHAKQVAILSEANVDIVGLQETSIERTEALADSLGWNAYPNPEHSTAIMSRYPLEEIEHFDVGLAARIDVGGTKVNVWDVHLGYTPYGPYDTCFDQLSVDEVLENEAESGRTGQIKDAIERMGDNLGNADEEPVLLLGDFNAPSQLDWTDDNEHCGYGFIRWPTSDAPLEADMLDSLREVYPDPSSDPHLTWSPIFKVNDDYDGQDEPQDRIDFIYHKGSALTPSAADSVVAGEPKPIPNHADNEWTSDHAAIVVTFDL